MFDFFSRILKIRRDNVTTADVERAKSPDVNMFTAGRNIERDLSPAEALGNSTYNINAITKVPELLAMVSAASSNCLGSGINIQCLDEAYAEVVEDFLTIHSRKKHWEVTASSGANEFFNSCFDEITKRGGVIIRKHYDNAWKHKVKLECVSVALIDYSKHDEDKNLFNGQQLDKYGAVQGFWFIGQKTNENSFFVPIDELIYWIPKWIDITQKTPVSRLSPATPTIDAKNQYTNAEIKTATKKANTPYAWATRLYSALVEAVITPKNAANALSGKYQDEIKAFAEARIKEANVNLRHSELLPIPLEDKITSLANDTANIYEALDVSSQRTAMAAIGQASALTLRNPVGVNYSTLTAFQRMTNRLSRQEFALFTQQILEPVMEWMEEIMILNGVLPANFHAKNKSLKFKFAPIDGFLDIDPLKTANANKIGLETNTILLEDIAAEKGRTVEEQIEKRAYEIAFMEAKIIEKRKELGVPDPMEEQKKLDTQQQEQTKQESATKTDAANNVNAMFAGFVKQIEAI